MPKVFVSYGRESMAAAEALASDIRALGHEAWFDQQLTGGQAWWNQILESVRGCDVFVFVLTPNSLRSMACMAEYGYAAALKRPILPVLVADGVSTNLLPPALSQIQFVDYRHQERSSGLKLARALATIPSAGPLPDPLPAPPDVPISYLGSVTEQIESRPALSYEQQSALVVDLKRGLRDPETSNDARALLARLRKRRDLLATIADEVDELLRITALPQPVDRGTPQTVVPPVRPSEAKPAIVTPPLHEARERGPADSLADRPAEQIPDRKERSSVAAWAGAAGLVIGVISMLTVNKNLWLFGFVTAAGLAVAGAISGRRMRMLVPAIVGAVVGWIVVMIAWKDVERAASAAVFGIPIGALLGVFAGFLSGRGRSRPPSGDAKAP